jgi:hypothetical protein
VLQRQPPSRTALSKVSRHDELHVVGLCKPRGSKARHNPEARIAPDPASARVRHQPEGSAACSNARAPTPSSSMANGMPCASSSRSRAMPKRIRTAGEPIESARRMMHSASSTLPRHSAVLPAAIAHETIGHAVCANRQPTSARIPGSSARSASNARVSNYQGVTVKAVFAELGHGRLFVWGNRGSAARYTVGQSRTAHQPLVCDPSSF